MRFWRNFFFDSGGVIFFTLLLGVVIGAVFVILIVSAPSMSEHQRYEKILQEHQNQTAILDEYDILVRVKTGEIIQLVHGSPMVISHFNTRTDSKIATDMAGAQVIGFGGGMAVGSAIK